MDGYEFLSHFRKLEGSEKTPVIIITAKDLSAKERKELASSVSEIFTKEENYVEDLIASVGALISESRNSESWNLSVIFQSASNTVNSVTVNCHRISADFNEW